MSVTISPQIARRLAVAAQRLDHPPEQADKAALRDIFRQLGCVQIDPINVVARTQLIVLWSRLGRDPLPLLSEFAWDDKDLFEYWAHAASLVLVEDFPIHQQQMVNFARGNGKWSKRVQGWLHANDAFRRYILDELRERGPLFSNEFEDRAVVDWQSSGWSNTRNVSTMLGFLWEQGDITVTRRAGNGFGLKKQWALFDYHMPQWLDHDPLPRGEVVRTAAQRSLRALGVATPKQIDNHFIRKAYPDLANVLQDLEQEGLIQRVAISDNGETWDGDWFVHRDDFPTLERLQTSAEMPARTVLLSPFDNLICDRDRTEQLFDFWFRIEIYVPKAKRQFGYYVLPILQGDRLVGRIDPRMDRKTKTLHVNAVYVEEGMDSAVDLGALADTIDDLGRALGAKKVVFADAMPAGWQIRLQSHDLA